MSDKMIGNKTVQYSVNVEQDGKWVPLMNTSTVQLPSWEKQADAIKGAGIMGELNMPSGFGFAAARTYAFFGMRCRAPVRDTFCVDEATG